MSHNKTQHNQISCAKFTKKYNYDYKIPDIEDKIKNNISTDFSIENSKISIKNMFTIFGVLLSVLFFCFSVYKEYTQNITDIKIIHIKIINDIEILDKKIDKIIDEKSNKQNYKNNKYTN